MIIDLSNEVKINNQHTIYVKSKYFNACLVNYQRVCEMLKRFHIK